MTETDHTMSKTDLMALSKEQLVEMVSLRGNALLAYVEADNVFREKIADGSLQDNDLAKLYDMKEAILIELGSREEALITSAVTSRTH